MIFAYEPVWAIGAAEAASAEFVCAVVGGLRRKIGSAKSGLEVRWLYGGAAGPGTWKGLKGELDGLFLGRFAHDANRLVDVLEEVREE